MKKIEVKGTIISNNLQDIYDWVGIEATSPSKVIGALPKDNSEVEVSINSGGGDVFAGSEIFTALKEYKGNVTVKIVGLAASAASVIAMAADKVLISPTAQLMIHNVSTSVGGDYRTFEHTAEILKSANQSIANAYKQRTGKSDEELKSLMDAETWFNAQTAVEHGFADEIMFENESFGGTLVANFGANMLSDEVIQKISQLIGKEPETVASTVDDKTRYEAKLKLMKMRGMHSEH